MPRIGAYLAVAALGAAVVVSPSPAAAFRIGPFHFGLPFSFGHRHHHHLYMRAAEPRRSEPGRRESAQSEPAEATTPALLYPNLALPAIEEAIFAPQARAAWPFGYDAILQTAFAKARPADTLADCRQVDRGSAVMDRLKEHGALDAEQAPLAQKLGEALGMASGYLARACPQDIPRDPVARLQLMQSQIETLTMALDLVRPPLQAVEQSFKDGQSPFPATLSAAPRGDRRPDAVASACGAMATKVDWSVEQISSSVQPNETQQNSLAGVKQAFRSAADDLGAHCPTALPPTALARLDAIQARLDATWRAVLSMQVALGAFEQTLTADQRNRFAALDFAAR